MSNELTVYENNDVTISENMSFEELAALTGQNLQRNVGFQRLRINKDFETDDGKQLIPGSYFLFVDGKVVYSKEVLFRPFVNVCRYEK